MRDKVIKTVISLQNLPPARPYRGLNNFMPFTAVGLFPTAFMHPVAALPALLDCSLAVPAFYAGGMPPLLFGRFFRRKGAAGRVMAICIRFLS